MVRFSTYPNYFVLYDHPFDVKEYRLESLRVKRQFSTVLTV
jgi:hypothetical protein